MTAIPAGAVGVPPPINSGNRRWCGYSPRWGRRSRSSRQNSPSLYYLEY